MIKLFGDFGERWREQKNGDNKDDEESVKEAKLFLTKKHPENG